jgi:peptidoglycan/xylan/chitin deacetylase (PgdA/CDA1 family)
MAKPAFVSLTFDDGLRCQFERAVPILDRCTLTATFFLIANTYPWHERPDWRKIEWDADDIQSLRGMAQRGHEIGSHSVNHKDPDPQSPKFDSSFDPKFEAEESKRLIESWMGAKIQSFCYPFCKNPEPLKNAVSSAKYEQARAGATGLSYYSPQESIDFLHVDCRQITANENVSEWIRPDCWHILMIHGIGGSQDGWCPIREDQFATQMKDLAMRRDSGDVEVVTFKDGAERLRQSK